ncbi:MAG: cobyrinate a,c-diamide synthase [Desulfovibrionaceae bacterium]
MPAVTAPPAPRVTVPCPPALMVGGMCSGCGKTTLTLALLAALRARHMVVQACKAGPDFIDPAHHAVFTGRPSYNLDAWMGGTDGLERAFAAAIDSLNASPAASPSMIRAPRDIAPHLQRLLLVEGVMGLFDGAAPPPRAGNNLGEGEGSSATVARLCALPVLLVVDVRGMAQSAAAVVQGFLRYRPDISFVGIVCTHVGGLRHQSILRQALAHCDAPLLGLLPRADAPHLPSRHLGLLMPHELHLHAAPLAAWLENHMDIDTLLRRLCPLNPSHGQQKTARVNTPAVTTSLTRAPSSPALPRHKKTRPTIAIAHDAAFCFLYPDFPEVLRQEGANTIFFSPLHDAVLPPCAALYLPGGYPELHAEQLSANTALRAAILAYAQSGGTIYGECGGYMYMMHSITTAAGTWPMTACLPLTCRLETQRAALGYRHARPASAAFWGDDTLCVRTHEYHYARVLPGPELPPLWQVSDAALRPLPDEGVQLGRLAGSWLHLYPQGARPLLTRFIQGLQP